MVLLLLLMLFFARFVRERSMSFSFVRHLLYPIVAIVLFALSGPSLAQTADAQPQPSVRTPPVCPYDVVSAAPDATLSKKLVSTSGWTGGDAAYTIALSSAKTLWLFGDSFIGKISGNRRVRPVMINNAAAWQQLESSAPLRFFWQDKSGKPAALLMPELANSYFWPGDGALIESRLYIFCKRIVDDPHTTGPFAFSWTGDDIVQIANPHDEPPSWRVRTLALPGGEVKLHLGAACLQEGKYLYVFGVLDETKESKKRPVVLARIHTSKLASLDLSGFEYLSRQIDENGNEIPDCLTWSNQPLHLVTLFDDGAPEFTVSSVPGAHGYFAVYSPNGLSKKIALRWAERPDGPWSDPVEFFDIPEAAEKNVLCYGAKNHPELSPELTLTVTYCCNPGELSAHVRRPYLYFPKAIKVLLKQRKTQSP